MDYLKAIDSCDDRIGRLTVLQAEAFQEVWEPLLKFGFVRRPLLLDYYDHSIKMIKIEKLIYLAVGRWITDKSNGAIFKKFYEKYADLLTESLEMLNKMVKKDDLSEELYLQNCKECIQQQKYIKALCESKDDIINPLYI